MYAALRPIQHEITLLLSVPRRCLTARYSFRSLMTNYSSLVLGSRKRRTIICFYRPDLKLFLDYIDLRNSRNNSRTRDTNLSFCDLDCLVVTERDWHVSIPVFELKVITTPSLCDKNYKIIQFFIYLPQLYDFAIKL